MPGGVGYGGRSFIGSTCRWYARGNAARHAVEVSFLLGDWYAPLGESRFDLIVANPPYVAYADPHLQHSGLPFEPRMALTDGVVGGDGLACLRAIAIDRRRGAARLCALERICGQVVACWLSTDTTRPLRYGSCWLSKGWSSSIRGVIWRGLSALVVANSIDAGCRQPLHCSVDCFS
jgi:hypothetical protein